jgi:hypothetical protein
MDFLTLFIQIGFFLHNVKISETGQLFRFPHPLTKRNFLIFNAKVCSICFDDTDKFFFFYILNYCLDYRTNRNFNYLIFKKGLF